MLNSPPTLHTAPGRWRSHPALAYALVLLATLLWAGNAVLGRALRYSAGPFTIAAARMVIASLVFLLLFRTLPTPERRLGRERPWVLAMALIGMVGCPVSLYLALRYTTATSTSLINGVGPLVTAVLTALLLHTRLTRGQLAGAVLSVFGVLLVIGAGAGRALAGLTPNLGDLIMLANVVMWGLYSIMSRIVTRTRSALWATAYPTWFSLLILIPAALVEWRQAAPAVNAAFVLSMLYMGVLATCVAFLAWNEGVRRLGPDTAMILHNMMPVFGALLGVLFLRERMAGGQWLGGALIVAGGVLAALRLQQRVPREDTEPAEAAEGAQAV